MTPRCRRCGHRLRTEVSRAIGVGPKCFRRARWRLRIRAPARRKATDDQLELDLNHEGHPMPNTNTLWAVHVQGPDSLIAQPDKATAEQRADEWTRMASQVRERSLADGANPEYLPNLTCVATQWPYDPSSHAEDLAEHGGNPDDIC